VPDNSHYSQALLWSVIDGLDKPISRLSMTSEAELEEVLRKFNATDAAPSEVMHRGQTVHGALEHWAAVQPNAPALVSEARAGAAWPCLRPCSPLLHVFSVVLTRGGAARRGPR